MIPDRSTVDKPNDDFETIGLQSGLLGERLRRGHISAVDAAIELEIATRPLSAKHRRTAGCEIYNDPDFDSLVNHG